MNPLSLLEGPYALLIKGVAIIVVVFGIYFYGHHKGYVEEKQVYDTFVAKQVALGAEAKADTKIKTAEGVANKKEADNENTTTHTAVTATVKRLRDKRASTSFVPTSPTEASRPELACFDRAEYIGAVGKLVEGIRGLADEGTAATIDLDTAKKWK